MTDEPSGAALLDDARRSLMEEVVPGLDGRPRYVALMVANALGIVAREILAREIPAREIGAREAGPSVDAPGARSAESVAALCAAIRDGARDGEGDLHAALTGAVEAAARVWKPARPGA